MDKNADINKNFFDPENYTTLIVGQGANEVNVTNQNNLVDLLTNPDNKSDRDDALRLLKAKPGALDLLIDTINNKKYLNYKTQLIAACWESGIDCRSQLTYFVNLAIQDDYLNCIEATSVIDGMDPPLNEVELNNCIALLNKSIELEMTNKKELLIQLAKILFSYKAL